MIVKNSWLIHKQKLINLANINELEANDWWSSRYTHWIAAICLKARIFQHRKSIKINLIRWECNITKSNRNFYMNKIFKKCPSVVKFQGRVSPRSRVSWQLLNKNMTLPSVKLHFVNEYKFPREFCVIFNSYCCIVLHGALSKRGYIFLIFGFCYLTK